MLLADAEGFWKSPNVFDAAGIAGLLVGVLSIWLSWWLARRDIEKRLEEAAERASRAAREEVRRVARAVLQNGLASAIRFLELSREAANGRRWGRAGELCSLTREQVNRVLAQPGGDDELLAELRDTSAALLGYLAALGNQTRERAGELPRDVRWSVDEAILTLHRADARLTAIRTD
jgi:hypothetical protein